MHFTTFPTGSSEPGGRENQFDVDITITGWVPLIQRSADWPQFLRDASAREQFALGSLFKFSGNPTFQEDSNPDPATMDLAVLEKLIDSRNFRCAIRIQNIRAFRNDAMRVIGVKLDYFARSGYTPFSIFPERPFFSEGAAQEVRVMPWVTPDEQSNRDIIEVGFAFRLGWFPDTLGRLFTGYWAPWAWVSILLELRDDGNVAVAWKGSSFPSASLFINKVKPGT